MSKLGEDNQCPTTLRCSRCGSENTIPIIYGYPTEDTMETCLEADRNGEIKMGGCCVSERMPTYYCKDCGRDSGLAATITGTDVINSDCD